MTFAFFFRKLMFSYKSLEYDFKFFKSQDLNRLVTDLVTNPKSFRKGSVSLHFWSSVAFWQSKFMKFRRFSRYAQLSGGFFSKSLQTVTVGNWISSIGAAIVSNVVIVGSSAHWVKAEVINNPDDERAVQIMIAWMIRKAQVRKLYFFDFRHYLPILICKPTDGSW